MPPMCGMRRITASGTLLLLAALATRCGDNGPNAGLEGAAEVDQLAAGITQAFCAWQFRCCSTPELEILQGGRFDDEASCVQSGISVSVKDQLLIVRTAVGEGLMTIDTAKAAACVETYRNRPCNPPMGPNPDPYMQPTTATTPSVHELMAACPDIFTGMVADGNRCDMTAECAAGSRCVGGGTGGAPGGYDPYNPTPPPATTMPVGGLGICARAQQANEPCNTTAECDLSANLVCQASNFQCGAPPGVSQRCNLNPLATSINPNELCGKGLVCDFNSLLCRRLPGEGDPCFSQGTPTGQCGTSSTLVCVGFGSGGIGTCKRPGARGEACGAHAIAPCGAGLACRPTQPDGIGVCGDAPGRGEPCDSTGACANPNVCSPYYGVCQAPGPKHLGEDCTTSEQCVSLSCQPVALSVGICVPAQQTVVCSSHAVTPGRGTFISPMSTGAAGASGGGNSFDAGVPIARDAGLPLPPI